MENMNYFDEINRLKKKIDDSEIISFDIFDTLLLRNVMEPKDIFRVVDVEYYGKYNKKINFYKKRIEAENKARSISNKEEITFDEIYTILSKEYGEKVSEILRKLEIEAEMKFIIPNKYIFDLYNYAIEKKKKVILISDMYLSKKQLTDILEKNRYKDFDELFVSSEINRTKASGSMYSYIKDNLNISKSEKWIHIGDNYVSDVKMADKNGINGLYYKKISDREKKRKIDNLTESIIYAIQINTKYSIDQDYWNSFGIMYVAPIFIGLMFDMHQWMQGKDNIYFLARDGYMPFQLYKKMMNSYSDLPHGKYIYASRRAYIYPALVGKKKEAIDYLTIYNSHFNQKLTLRDILINLELESDKDVEAIIKKTAFDINQIISEKNLLIVKDILSQIWPQINKKLIEERQILDLYLKQEGLLDYKTINIFDIGWAGSTQAVLKEILKKNINGYYFGTTEAINKNIRSDSHGYAFNRGTPKSFRDLIIDNTMIYELIFTAPEGSLKKFNMQNNIILPVLKNTQDKANCEAIKKFQDSAMIVFEKILEYKKYICNISKQFCLSPIFEMLKQKNICDLIEFNKMKNIVSVGESKDYKVYVTKVMYDDYYRNIFYYKKQAQLNLWRGGLLIEDKQGRLFNSIEFEKLYSIKSYSDILIKLERILILMKKAIKNPKKAIIRLLHMKK